RQPRGLRETLHAGDGITWDAELFSARVVKTFERRRADGYRSSLRMLPSKGPLVRACEPGVAAGLKKGEGTRTRHRFRSSRRRARCWRTASLTDLRPVSVSA